MPLSICARSMALGWMKYGSWKALMMRSEACERSSSTTAMLARCGASGTAVAPS
ncbi:hypothetical protein SSTU70S_05428 [Stutzerimonas stutzeri]